VWLALAAAAFLAAACGSGGGQPSTPTSPTASGPTGATGVGTGSAPSPGGDLAAARVELRPVATLDQPLAMAVRAGDPALYVAEKVGRVVALTDGAEPRTVLDLTGQVSLGSEQGLLGLAFSPDGAFLYVNFTDTAGDTHVTEYRFGDVVDQSFGSGTATVCATSAAFPTAMDVGDELALPTSAPAAS